MNLQKSIVSVVGLGVMLTWMICVSMNDTTVQENNEIISVQYEESNICIEQIQVQGYHKEIPIKIEMHIDMETDQIISVEILEHSESSDYGAYIEEEWFLQRFYNNTIDTPFELVPIMAEENHEIVAVTGATISSKAVVTGINKGMEHYMSIK